MEKEKISRMNELYKKQKSSGLSDEEKAEQAKLREQYRNEMRSSFLAQLDSVYIKMPDGTIKKALSKKESEKKE